MDLEAARRQRVPRRAPLRGQPRARRRSRWVAGLALATSLAAGPALTAPGQVGLGSGSGFHPCRYDPPFRTPLHLLSWLPSGVTNVIVDGWFELVPRRPPERLDRYFLRDDRGLGARIGLLPFEDFDDDFRWSARSLMGRHLEIGGCLEGGRAGDPGGVLRFFSYAVIPEADRERPPREVELESLRNGDFDGQRVLLRGVLAGRRHRALRVSSRMSDSDWVLASGDAAAWMRGHGPEGEGFRLDPDDTGDHGRGLAVVGMLGWWHDAPVVHVESVRMTRAPGRDTVAVLFTLPLDGRLGQAEQTIEVRFSAAMDEASFEGRVALVDGDGEPVPARWHYDAGLWSLLVSPEPALAPGAELELRLRDGIASAEGDSVRPEPEATEGLVLVRRYRIGGS